VCLDFGDDVYEESVEEVVRLVQSAGVRRHRVVRGKRQRPDPKFYAGSGKVAEIERAAGELNAAFVIFNHALSPAQERNVEKELQRRVMDRSELILEIFAQRAQTNEGKLQVELAQLRYRLPRLRGRGTELSQQGAGIGTRGPGETKLEVDRRRLLTRIQRLERDIKDLGATRSTQRKARRRRELPTIALVGYTNAGKSTLMRALTGSAVLVANKLFATLDTTVRALHPEGVPRVLVSDTVGFIKNLPHALVVSFKTTLDEALEASLLAHVVDASDPGFERQLAVTEEVLEEIGAKDVPRLVVFNKIDCGGDAVSLRARYPGCIVMSARSEADVAKLRDTIRAFFRQGLVEAELFLPWAAQKLRGEVFSTCEVLEERADGTGAFLRVRGDPAAVKLLQERAGSEGRDL
jgi:GTP-binding protein HflX